MKLSELKQILQQNSTLNFKLPNGNLVPTHFHITEVGLITKHFMDCGGVLREESYISLQIWVAGDMEHRLSSEKFLAILAKSAFVIGQKDLDIVFEYQTDTIGKYNVTFVDGIFYLLAQNTNCLATDNCGISSDKIEFKPLEVSTCCSPKSSCC